MENGLECMCFIDYEFEIFMCVIDDEGVVWVSYVNYFWRC